ncbi:hypothetical protein KP509_32G074100 [Ceratopteris richardii]|uniref:Laccase n=2 Tax=Ceratopteris richardii TaxID=49495 RepID=A0A8T2QUJ2_CERRI|nr:hypothetical protein KP509_32G074100 [Ceratopteris richardii]
MDTSDGIICRLLYAWSLLLVTTPAALEAQSITRRFAFHVRYQNVTRLCSTKVVPTVNGQVPGPTMYMREGDRVLVKVNNELHDKNITIHWHGLKQVRTGWADGPGYVTQCPMKPGTSYTYNFTVSGQRGTLWWHGHNNWMRYTVYGAIVILPKKGDRYPFPKPYAQIPLVLGEWWKASMDAVLQQLRQTGGGPNISDAYTINGQPGDLYPCSATERIVIPVKSGKTYMLRIAGATMNGEMFLSVAGHKLTVVEVDASYTKPVEMDYVLITPGQSMNVLLKADQPVGTYYLAVRPYIAPNINLDNTTATAVIAYEGSNHAATPAFPTLPAINDSVSANALSRKMRSLASEAFPARVPLQIDRHLFFTLGLAIRPCANCTLGGRLSGVFNNISLELPKTALLQAHYFRKPNVFVTNFPDNPTSAFNYTGRPPNNTMAKSGTRLSFLPFNSSVQLVLQSTAMVAPENHPIHLHGTNFFVVGMGLGNYNASSDPSSFNLLDPPERNTIGVPMGGWVALRLQANNPGVWFMHCHLEFHTSVGLATAFVVEDGPNPEDKLIPPPSDLPPC